MVRKVPLEKALLMQITSSKMSLRLLLSTGRSRAGIQVTGSTVLRSLLLDGMMIGAFFENSTLHTDHIGQRDRKATGPTFQFHMVIDDHFLYLLNQAYCNPISMIYQPKPNCTSL